MPSIFCTLISLCFFHIWYRPHSNYLLGFLAEGFGNLLIMIRSLKKTNLNFGLLSLNDQGTGDLKAKGALVYEIQSGYNFSTRNI